jgi:ribonuclease E
MGRGRAKAKQVKVARQLKYSGGGMDLDQLRAEFGVGADQRDADDHAAYADFANRYSDDDEDEDEDDEDEDDEDDLDGDLDDEDLNEDDLDEDDLDGDLDDEDDLDSDEDDLDSEDAVSPSGGLRG